MTNKTRINKLEQKIKPKAKAESVRIWETSEYENEAALDQEIKDYDKDNPDPEVKRGPEKVRHIIMDTGFKGWFWDWWEREFISPDEMRMRKQEMRKEYGESYGKESTHWPEGYVEGRFKEKDRKFIKAG